MKLAFLIKAFCNAKGGAERVLRDVSGYLARHGHEVSVISFDHPGCDSFYALDDRVRWYRLGIGVPSRKARPWEVIRRMAALRSHEAVRSADVVIGFMHSAFVPAALALIGTGTCLIGSEHIVPAHYRQRPLEYALLLLSAPLLDAISVHSERMRDDFPAALRRSMIVIPIPLPSFACDDRQSALAARSNRILSVGRLEPQKDPLTLIEAFARIAVRFPDWTLRIVGEGSLRAALERRIHELGIESQVELLAPVTDIATEYRQAEIFVIASRYESLGLVTAEAMSLGLPAIGFSDCAGTNDLISDGESGLLVDPGDRVASLSQAMESLIEDPDLRSRMGAVAQRAMTAYGGEAALSEWESALGRFAESAR